MRYALSWLRDYVAIKSDAERLGDRLTMTTAELEEIILPPEPVKGGLIAEVTAIEPHPNADRLRLVTVRSKRGTDTVVCGAPNVAVGQKVPFLPAGSTYVGDGGAYCKLAPAKIRGVNSAGMLASEHDLGLSNDHSGILQLPGDVSLNDSLDKILNLDQPIIELEITPNRGDLLSYYGLAREVAFLEKTRLVEPPLASISDSDRSDIDPAVKIESTACSRYTALTLVDLTNGTSPVWLQQRLRASGIEPINAVVDVTNYVMLELGQPLHAFDLAAVCGSRRRPQLIVRAAREGERLATLDGITRTLSIDDFVIATPDGPVAMAGLIGGRDSAVLTNTTQIILESATFDPGETRRMAKRHNLRTEAVTRFEKGVDSELPVRALKRAAYLLQQICGGRPAGGVVDPGQGPQRPRRLSVDLERASRRLGLTVNKSAARALEQIGFTVSDKKSSIVEVTVPSWRTDVTIEEDVFEEIIRLIGYDQLPATLPAGPINPTSLDNTFEGHRSSRRFWAAAGYREVVTQAFLSDSEAEIYGQKRGLVKIANPPTRNESNYRNELLPALINRLIREAQDGAQRLLSFEIGHVAQLVKKAVHESSHLAAAVLTTDPQNALRQLKGLAAAWPGAIDRRLPLTYTAHSGHPYLEQVQSVMIDGQTAGVIGIVSDHITTRKKLRGRKAIVGLEINAGLLLQAPVIPAQYEPRPPFPAVSRDLSLQLEKKQSWLTAERELHQNPPPHATSLLIGDIYQDEQRKGLTLHLVFRAPDRTLTDAEVGQELDDYLLRLKALGYRLTL